MGGVSANTHATDCDGDSAYMSTKVTFYSQSMKK